MEFGHLASLDGVDFSLPPGDPRSDATLAAAPRTPARVHVGATGWTTKEWQGRVYPRGVAASDQLGWYGRQFNSIELNTTWYRTPDAETVRRWREAVPEGFRFFPKFPQEASHDTSGAALASARRFCEVIRVLGDRLGRSFVQLPPSFGPDEAPRLDALLAAIDVPVAVEFRHPRWFESNRLSPRAFELLATRRAAAVITDVAGRRDVVHGSLPVPAVMIRFVGNALHPTDFARLDGWAQRLASWLSRGLEELAFFGHQPDNVLAPELCNALVERLNATAGTGLRPWTPPAPRGQLSLL
jgi:uncharacterized protein YecE (DUF72 family)